MDVRENFQWGNQTYVYITICSNPSKRRRKSIKPCHRKPCTWTVTCSSSLPRTSSELPIFHHSQSLLGASQLQNNMKPINTQLDSEEMKPKCRLNVTYMGCKQNHWKWYLLHGWSLWMLNENSTFSVPTPRLQTHLANHSQLQHTPSPIGLPLPIQQATLFSPRKKLAATLFLCLEMCRLQAYPSPENDSYNSWVSKAKACWRAKPENI